MALSVIPLLPILACPIDQGKLAETEDGRTLRCTTCGYLYSIHRKLPDLRPPKSHSVLQASKDKPQ